MIRTIYIPKKEIQVIDLRNLCKRKKQLEAIDVSLCPKSTAIVKDQDGNELAREDIASGATGIIPVNVGGGVLYTYPYDSFNTGQDVSYATGDDKWVRDNVFNPEIASWPTDRPWVFPVLDPNDPTKLLRGSNPDGSGTNIFGNLERFTDENGGQDYLDGYKIDHYTGIGYNINIQTNTWLNLVADASISSFNGVNDWFFYNRTILESISSPTVEVYSINLITNKTFANNWFIHGSTLRTNVRTYYMIISSFPVRPTNIDSGTFKGYFVRKAFTYNPTTKQMELV